MEAIDKIVPVKNLAARASGNGHAVPQAVVFDQLNRMVDQFIEGIPEKTAHAVKSQRKNDFSYRIDLTAMPGIEVAGFEFVRDSILERA